MPFIKINSIGSMEINWKEKDTWCLYYFLETKSFIWRVNGKYLAIWGHLANITSTERMRDVYLTRSRNSLLPHTADPRGAQCWKLWNKLVTQLVKNSPAVGDLGFQSWVGKIPMKKKGLRTPVFWPGELHGLWSTGSQEFGHKLGPFTFMPIKVNPVHNN